MAESFSSRLQKLRRDNGLTQAQLGAKLGKADSTVRMWELGRNQPDHDSLLRLARIFQVSTDYLLGRSDILQISVSGEDNEALAAVRRRPALQELVGLAYKSSDEELEAIVRIARGFLHK